MRKHEHLAGLTPNALESLTGQLVRVHKEWERLQEGHGEAIPQELEALFRKMSSKLSSEDVPPPLTARRLRQAAEAAAGMAVVAAVPPPSAALNQVGAGPPAPPLSSGISVTPPGSEPSSYWDAKPTAPLGGSCAELGAHHYLFKMCSPWGAVLCQRCGHHWTFKLDDPGMKASAQK